MAQAQILAMFNQTMKFGGSEPSIGSAEPSLIAPPPPSNPPVFQIFKDDDEADADKENAAYSNPAPAPFAIFKDPTEKINVAAAAAAAAAPSSSAQFAIFKDPTEKLNVPKGGRGILKSSSSSNSQQNNHHGPLVEKSGENVYGGGAGASTSSKPGMMMMMVDDQLGDQLGDITSFNPPESSTVNLAAILKSQGVKNTRQLYQNQEPTVKFTVPTKQLRQAQKVSIITFFDIRHYFEHLFVVFVLFVACVVISNPYVFVQDVDMENDAIEGDPFGGVTEFIPPSCSTKNWQQLAMVAQKNIVLEATNINVTTTGGEQNHDPRPSNSLQPPPPLPPIAQGDLYELEARNQS